MVSAFGSNEGIPRGETLACLLSQPSDDPYQELGGILVGTVLKVINPKSHGVQVDGQEHICRAFQARIVRLTGGERSWDALERSDML